MRFVLLGILFTALVAFAAKRTVVENVVRADTFTVVKCDTIVMIKYDTLKIKKDVVDTIIILKSDTSKTVSASKPLSIKAQIKK